MYIRVIHDGKPARLHVTGSDFFLEPLGSGRSKLTAEEAKRYLDRAFELQRMKAKEILESATSIWLMQPGIKDVSCEIERIASGLDEVELRLRAQAVKLAAVQGKPYIQSVSAGKGEGHTVTMAPIREPVKVPAAPEPSKLIEAKKHNKPKKFMIG